MTPPRSGPFSRAEIRRAVDAVWDPLLGREECVGQCATYSMHLVARLRALGYPATEVVGQPHVFLFLGGFIIDPTAYQLLDHPQTRGVFVGTPAELRALLRANPTRLRNTRDQDPERVWHAWYASGLEKLLRGEAAP